MSVAAILARADELGVQVLAVGDDLKARWSANAPPPLDLIAALKANRSAILAALSPPSDPSCGAAFAAHGWTTNGGNAEHFGNFGNFGDAYAQAEREAIATFDGGLPPDWAAAHSALEYGQRPAGMAEREWRSRLDRLWTRADEHGAAFAANGWTFEEVFGVGAHWARLDGRGPGWLAPDARIVEIAPERVVFEQGSRTMQHRKPGKVH